MQRLILILTLLFPAALLATDRPPGACVVCQRALTGRYYELSTPAFDEPVVICQECSRVRQRCAECALPAPGQVPSALSGRVLCVRHRSEAVFDRAAALEIFKEVKRDLTRMLAGSGTVPDRNITVALVTREQLDGLVAEHPEIHGESTLGLTRTQIDQDGHQEHSIYLLSGLTRRHLMGVCAHEYAHTWVNQNVRRELAATMVEGFCELTAYKLMDQYRHEAQKRAILANNYTQGKVNLLVQLDKDSRFDAILQWMINGVDKELSADSLAGVNVTRKPTAPTPAWAAQRSLKTAVPDRLTLKGISGVTGRRFALVNDCTMKSQEVTRVRVGRTHLTVRCLEISEQSVRLHLVDSNETVELFLKAK